jgi:hypothetical protein
MADFVISSVEFYYSAASGFWLMEFGDRLRTVCLLHRLAEGIRPCKLDQISADPKENWHRLARKKID